MRDGSNLCREHHADELELCFTQSYLVFKYMHKFSIAKVTPKIWRFLVAKMT